MEGLDGTIPVPLSRAAVLLSSLQVLLGHMSVLGVQWHALPARWALVEQARHRPLQNIQSNACHGIAEALEDTSHDKQGSQHQRAGQEPSQHHLPR